MATVLESPKPSLKQEEFVEKQISQARQRIRQLDYFSSGAVLLIATLVFVLAFLIVDRYVQTPGWTTWAVLGVYLLGAAGYLYLSLFRASRRAINPYYAAKQVEDTLPDAKNSVVNWVDLKDDEKIPGSVRAALGTRAAKDLKHVDLNQVIQKRHLLWLAGIAGVLFLASVVVAFLPATRTQMTLLSPKNGDITVTQGQDVNIEVELKGRIPAQGQPDAARMRMWTNPEDPNDYEERPLEPSEDNKKVWKITIPAKQIRSGGFQYKLLAGKVQTKDYRVTLRIRPEFAGFVVNYVPPSWSKRPPETTNDPNIVGFYGTDITLMAQINKPIKSGNLEVDGQVQLIPGEVINDSQDALKFSFKLEKNASYRIRFVTTENEKNTDAKTYTIKVLDAQPRLSEYEVSFKYPKYLRFEDEQITVREPHLEAMRGTEVGIVGHANRPLKSAQLTIQGHAPIPGQLNKEEPTVVKFTLPPLMEDGSYTVSFVPDTGEKETTTSPFTIKVNLDQKPTVAIVKPNEVEVELPANGTLHVEGRATDDFGIAKVTLRMQIDNQPLVSKPFRAGKSLKREKDGSYPTELEYFDAVELAKVKPASAAAAGFQLRPGMVIEYWLEAEDNCTVNPGPDHIGFSGHQRVKILAPVTAPEKKKEQEQQNAQEQKDKQERQQQQDEKLKNEKRDPKQKPKQGDQPKPKDRQEGQPKGGEPQPQEGNPDPANPMNAKGQQQQGEPQPRKNTKEDDNVEQTADQIAKNLPPEPKKSEPKKEETPQPPDVPPKKQPMNDMNQPPKPEDVQKIADQLKSEDPKERAEAQKNLEQAMKQLEKNPEAKKEAEKKLEEARKMMTPEQKKELDEAMKKAQEKLQQDKAQEEQKQKEEAKKKLEEMKELARQLDSKNENERKKAQEQIEKMMKEQQKAKPDAGEQKQDDVKKHLNEEERKELAQAKEKINDELQKQVQKQKEQQAKQELNEMKDLNQKLKSNDQNERKQAQQKLDKMMQDQAKGKPEASEKQSQETRDNLPNEQQKQEFDQAQQQLRNSMKQRAQQKKQDDAEDHLHRLQELAKNLDSPDENERKRAEEDLERLTRENNKPKPNPQDAEAQKKKEEELRKNLPNDEKRQAFDKAKEKVEQAMKKKGQEQKEEQAQQQLDAMKNLAKNLDSKDEKVKKDAQDQLEKIRKEQANAKSEDTAKQKNDLRNNLKDDKQKQEFDQAQQKIAGEMQKQEDARRPKPDDIQQAAKQLGKEGSSPEKQQAQQKLDDWLKDPKNKDQVEKGLEAAKKQMNPQEQKNVDKALDQAKKSGQEEDRAAEAAKEVGKQAKKLADQLNSNDPMEKKQAQDNLEKAMKEAAKNAKGQPDAQKELDKVRNQLPKDQQADFDKSMQQIAEHLKDQQAGAKSTPKPEDIKKNADKLAKGGDSPEKKDAQKQLEDWMNDPKNKEQVEKELNKLANDMKDPQQKKNLQNAIKEAKENLAKNPQPKGDDPKNLKPEDVDKLAKQLQGEGNTPARQDAMKKLENAMKDPKQRDEIQKQLEEMKKNLTDDAAKKNLEKAMKEMAKNMEKGQTPTPDDIQKLAQQLQKMDEKEQEAAKKQLEEMMKDVKAREQIQKQLNDYKNNIKNNEARNEFQRHIGDLAEKLAKYDRDSLPATGKKDLDPPAVAELKHKLHAGELLLEKFKRQMTNEEFQKQSKMTPAQLAEFQKKYEQYLSRLRNDLSHMEKEVITRGSGTSNLNQTTNVKTEEKKTGDELRGGRYIAPPGFADPYKKFTEDISGVKNPPKN